jgi:hypothetical protein
MRYVVMEGKYIVEEAADGRFCTEKCYVIPKPSFDCFYTIAFTIQWKCLLHIESGQCPSRLIFVNSCLANKQFRTWMLMHCQQLL